MSLAGRWGRQRGELSAGGGDELVVGVGVPGETPSTVWGFGEQHPRPVGERRVAGGVRDDRR